MLDKNIINSLLTAQKNEITENIIYSKLSEVIKDSKNKDILRRIASEELKHYNIFKEYTNKDVKPDKLKILKYWFISRVLGLTFGIKLLEKGEKNAGINYGNLSQFLPIFKDIVKDENGHEKELIGLIDEERLKYIRSMVLGLNDALIELMGVLAGLTFAFKNTRLIAMVGLITGMAGALSMAASEYLSTKSEEGNKNPLKAAIYTGSVYIFTMLILVFPYLIFSSMYLSVGLMVFDAILMIYICTFYISVAKDISFKERFFEMSLISLGVAVLSFIIGILIKKLLNIQI
ncbi:MAG: VIT1/CCC1 transporter family protein [Elusimicrobia bacterium]|nr:VIT1/CCC1 transporter family protein [Elusimicrobiota bacterium]